VAGPGGTTAGAHTAPSLTGRRRVAGPRRVPAATVLLVLVCVGLLLAAPPAGAHAPLGAGDNESLVTATEIPDPTKSWAIYAELHEGGEAQYYRFEATRGDVVAVQLLRSPAAADDGFVPSVAVMGPGIEGEGVAPAFLETPAGAGTRVVTGRAAGDVMYEPFSPGALREVATAGFTASRDGTYYLAVFGNDRGGRYGLAVGSRESFTLREWVTVPLFFAGIYAWEGQSLWLVYLPAALVVVGGLVLLGILARRGRRLDLPGWAASVAGLLFIASGATVAVQLVVAQSLSGPDPLVVATLLLAALPVALGAVTIRLAFRNAGGWTRGSRLVVAALGVAGLFVWAGWIAGPALAVVSALLPSRARREPLR
jgi:hypothetical protein